MTKEEILAFANSEEGSAIFTEIATEKGLRKFSKEAVEEYLTKDNEGKSLLFSKYDVEHNRRMKKYKEEGGFQKDFDLEFQKRNPQMTEEQKKLMDLQTELDNYKKKELIGSNKSQLKDTIEKFGIHSRIADMLITEDIDLSRNKLEEFGKEYQEYTSNLIEKGINEKLGATGKPLVNAGNYKKLTMAEYEKMTREQRNQIPIEEINKLFGGI